MRNNIFAIIIIEFILLSQCFSQTLEKNIVNANLGNSSVLELKNKKNEFVIQQMTKSEREMIPSPVVGLMIFQTDDTLGLYIYNAKKWVQVYNCFINNKHAVGDIYGGGIIFYVTPDELHGLIAETQDQSSSCTLYNAQDIISNPENHSTTGKNYTDWRAPTEYELHLLYSKKSIVGGFANNYYWSSTQDGMLNNWQYNFTNGKPARGDKSCVRAIRSF